MGIISIENIQFKYPETNKLIVDTTSTEIEEGEFIGLIGGNGSGKSTLLKLILGLLEPVKGDITVLGTSPKKASQNIGYVSQFEDVDFSFPITVYEVVRMGLIRHSFLNRFSDKDKKIIEYVMKDFDIWSLKDELIGNVSGGQKQKAFLARALVFEPKILILDEPLANLDIKTQRSFFDVLKKLNDANKTIIVVEHNLEMLIEYCNKIICIDKCIPNALETHTDNLPELLHIDGNT